MGRLVGAPSSFFCPPPLGLDFSSVNALLFFFPSSRRAGFSLRTFAASKLGRHLLVPFVFPPLKRRAARPPSAELSILPPEIPLCRCSPSTCRVLPRILLLLRRSSVLVPHKKPATAVFFCNSFCSLPDFPLSPARHLFVVPANLELYGEHRCDSAAVFLNFFNK